jgi:hypothetical protein
MLMNKINAESNDTTENLDPVAKDIGKLGVSFSPKYRHFFVVNWVAWI